MGNSDELEILRIDISKCKKESIREAVNKVVFVVFSAVALSLLARMIPGQRLPAFVREALVIASFILGKLSITFNVPLGVADEISDFHESGWPIIIALSRTCLAAGLLYSMYAQIRVDRFFEKTELFKHTDMAGKTLGVNVIVIEWIERNWSWSNVFLIIVLMSLLTIDAPMIHMSLVCFYLFILWYIDRAYSRCSITKSSHPFIEEAHVVFRRFSCDLYDTIDRFTPPIVALFIMSSILYVYGEAVIGEKGPWQYVSEVFISGAIGVHLVATSILVRHLTERWRGTLSNIQDLAKNLYSTETNWCERLSTSLDCRHSLARKPKRKTV